MQDINHEDGAKNRGNLLTAVLRASLIEGQLATTNGGLKDAFTED
jgi:hypothetical protein